MLQKLIVRMFSRPDVTRTVTKHELRLKISVPKDAAGDPDALAKEIEAAVGRELEHGIDSDPAATKAALEEIARRHGGKLDDFRDD